MSAAKSGADLPHRSPAFRCAHAGYVPIALDVEAGFALLTDRWLRLGSGAGSLAPADEIIRRAALWLAEGSS